MPEVDRRELVAILAGGVIGAWLRTGLVELIPVSPGEWPWATFIANLLGAFALGYFATRLQERLPLSAYRRPLLGTGLCGALTTFSTVQVELVGLAQDGYGGLAAAYAATSIALGFVALQVATNVVRRVRIGG
jgi:CrcB protein